MLAAVLGQRSCEVTPLHLALLMHNWPMAGTLAEHSDRTSVRTPETVVLPGSGSHSW